jgi:hypothetical protein
MFATFCLAYIDIAYRIGNWLRERNLEWPAAMVLVSGQSGRPTAGVTWSSNNICNLIWQASDGRLPPERLYVAPHAPPFSAADNLPGSAGLAEIEQTCRRIWCHTRASVEVARLMFPDQPAFGGVPEAMHDMPPIASIEDRAACVARLRRIMEDPRQLLSNCVADYVVEQLRRHGNRPEAVPVPGSATSSTDSRPQCAGARPAATFSSSSISSARSAAESMPSAPSSIVAEIFSARWTTSRPFAVRWICWARRSSSLRTRWTQPRSTIRSSVTARFGAEMSSAWPSRFWLTCGFAATSIRMLNSTIFRSSAFM